MKTVLKNPTEAMISAIISTSERAAARWIRDSLTGDIYAWPAEQHEHAQVAELNRPGTCRHL